MKKKWREAAGGGFTGSFADFADAFNKLAAKAPVDASLKPEDVTPFTDDTRPPLRILGMPPVAFGGVLVGTLFIVGLGIKLIFFNKKSQKA